MWFVSRVRAGFVDEGTGEVMRKGLRCLAQWSRQCSLEVLLTEIKRYSFTFII